MGTLINVMIVIVGLMALLIGAQDNNPYLGVVGLLILWAGVLACIGVIEGGDGI